MLTFEPCHARHLEYIAVTSIQKEEYRALLTPGVVEQLLQGVAISGWANGVCLGAAGIVPLYQGNAEAWMLLGSGCGPYLKPILRHIRYVLDTTHIRRIEMHVQASNKSGHSFARALKFEYEATLEGKHCTGDDLVVYKRMKRWL